MRKPLIITLLLAAATGGLLWDSNLQSMSHAHPYATVSWLAAILAFVVAGVMLGQFFIHCRLIYLYAGMGYIVLGAMSILESLAVPDGQSAHGAMNQCMTAWQIGWLFLGIGAILGMLLNRRIGTSQQRISITMVVCGVTALCSAAAVYFISNDPSYGGAVDGRSGLAVNIVCGLALIVAGLWYRRVYSFRNNALLSWLSYGLLTGALAQLVVLVGGRSYGGVFGFANLLKVLSLLMPLGGMLAEFTRLQVKLDDQVSELTNLGQIQRVVSTVTTPSDLYQRIADLASFSFGATATCLMPFDQERSLLYVAARAGFDDEVCKQLVFRASEGSPGDCYTQRKMVYIRDVSFDPVLSQKLDGVSGLGSAVFAPLVVREDECLGVLCVFFEYAGNRGYRLSKDQLRLLDSIAMQTAIAIDGVHLRSRVLTSNRASDDYSRDLDIMWEIGQAVAANLDVHSLVDSLADRLKQALDAVNCSVLIYEADAVGLRIMGNRKMVRYQSVPDHADNCDALAAMVAKKNEPLTFNHVPNSRHCKYAEMVREDGGEHHVLSVPMSLRGFMGAISVFRQNGEPFGDRERRLLMRLAPMVAVGIRSAELYEREKRLSENLAKSFMPELERDLPGLRIAGRYKAAYDDSLVGGDFYDVIPFGNAKYGVLIGDVAGKGVEAAVYTGMARYMVHAYSSENPDPVDVVAKLNKALCKYTPVGKFVTLVFGVLDMHAKTLTYVNAGHESPFHFKGSDSSIHELKNTGPAVGAMMIEAEFSADTVRFEPGDILVLYTDGATDVRSEGKFLGTDGLRRFVAANIRKSPYDLPDAIMNSIRNYATGNFRDDIAILVLEGCTPGALF